MTASNFAIFMRQGLALEVIWRADLQHTPSKKLKLLESRIDYNSADPERIIKQIYLRSDRRCANAAHNLA
jgi:hypothetical protein